jgi:hypothetical protein
MGFPLDTWINLRNMFPRIAVRGDKKSIHDNNLHITGRGFSLRSIFLKLRSSVRQGIREPIRHLLPLKTATLNNISGEPQIQNLMNNPDNGDNIKILKIRPAFLHKSPLHEVNGFKIHHCNNINFFNFCTYTRTPN